MLLPPAWYMDTMAPRRGASGWPKYVRNELKAKLGVMMPESLMIISLKIMTDVAF